MKVKMKAAGKKEKKAESVLVLRKENQNCVGRKKLDNVKVFSSKNRKKICCSFEKRKYLSWILFEKEQETYRGN